MHSNRIGQLVIERLRASGWDTYVLAKFFPNATAKTIADAWVKKGKAPKGENLNILWHVLATAGAPSPELADVPELGHYLGQLLAFGLIDMVSAQVICGGVQPNAVFDIIRGDGVPAKQDKDWPLERLHAEYDAALQAAMQKVHQAGLKFTVTSKAGRPDGSSASTAADKPAADLASTEPQAPDTDDRPSSSRETYLRRFAEDLAKLGVSIRYVLSLSPEENQYVRDLVGDRAIFDLANNLSALGNERIRLQRQGR